MIDQAVLLHLVIIAFSPFGVPILQWSPLDQFSGYRFATAIELSGCRLFEQAFARNPNHSPGLHAKTRSGFARLPPYLKATARGLGQLLDSSSNTFHSGSNFNFPEKECRRDLILQFLRHPAPASPVCPFIRCRQGRGVSFRNFFIAP